MRHQALKTVVINVLQKKMHYQLHGKLVWIICHLILSKLPWPFIYVNTEYWTRLKSMNHDFCWLCTAPNKWSKITNLFLSVPNYTLMEIKSHTATFSIEIVTDLFKQNHLFTNKNLKKCVRDMIDYRLLNSRIASNLRWYS